MLKCRNCTWHGKENSTNLENWTKFASAILYFKVQKGHHECLSVGTSLYLNVEIEPKTKWCGDEETEPMENLHLGNGISVSAIEKWLPFHKYASYGKISNYWPLKVWVSGFVSIDRNGIPALAIMKKSKNGCHFVNMCCKEKCEITDPPKVWVSGFLSVNRNGIAVSAIMKFFFKNVYHFINVSYGKNSNYRPPPKVWVSGLPNESPVSATPPHRADTHPWPCGQTDTCENINFANFVCGQ